MVRNHVTSYRRHLPCSRNLSLRARAHNQRVVSESDALAEEVLGVNRAIERDIRAARERAEQDEAWKPVLEQLLRAQSIVRGNGPAGDLCVAPGVVVVVGCFFLVAA